MNKSWIFLYTLWISCLAFLTACNQKENTLIYCYQAVNYQGWNDQDTLFIDLPPVDSTSVFKTEYKVRLLRDYAYTNLQLRVWLEEADSQQVRTTVYTKIARDSISHIPDSTHMEHVIKKARYTVICSDTTSDTIQHIRNYPIDKVSFLLFEANEKNTQQSPSFAWTQIKGKNIRLKKGKTYRMKIVHNMRERTIQGITNIGVKLTADNQNE